MNIDTTYVIAAVFVGSVLVLFSFERFLWRWILMARVRFSWFPAGRFILFVCPESHPSRTLVEREILPGLGDAAYFYALCTARIWTSDPDARLAASLAKWFMEPDREGPVAIIFKPGYEFERIDFAEALAAYAEGSDGMINSRRDRLYRIAEKVGDAISVFI